MICMQMRDQNQDFIILSQKIFLIQLQKNTFSNIHNVQLSSDRKVCTGVSIQRIKRGTTTQKIQLHTLSLPIIIFPEIIDTMHGPVCLDNIKSLLSKPSPSLSRIFQQ